MAYIVGVSPGSVYTQTDLVRGKCPIAGTRINDSIGGKEFIMVEITAGNVLDGTVVTINADFKATTVAAGTSALTRGEQCGVIRATTTASASAMVWAQIWGRGNVLASTSCNPNVTLGVAATAGYVDDTVTSLSTVIDGIVTTQTSLTVAGLAPCIINYPRFGGGAL